MNSTKRLILALCAILFLTTFSSATAGAAPVTANVIKTIRSTAAGDTVQTFRYHSSHVDQVGDVYYDTDWVGTKRRAIIIAHGGYWHNADRSASNAMAQKFYAAGFVVFNIDYRLAADHAPLAGSGATGTVAGSRWPAQRIDVALAYDFLKANAAQFGVDPVRVGLYGFSAGGHIVSVAAGYYGTARFQAVASVSAIVQPHRIMDIVKNGQWGNDVATPNLFEGVTYISSVLGMGWKPEWTAAGNLIDSFKPETYFGADKPAFYAIKGDADPVEPISSQNALEYWLTQAGQDHKTITVPDRGHDEYMVRGSDAADVARWNALVAWFNAKL